MQAVLGAPYKTPLHFAQSRLPTRLASELNVYGSLTALRPALQSRAVSRTEYPEGADLTLAGGGPTSRLAQGPRVGLWESGELYFTYKRSSIQPTPAPKARVCSLEFQDLSESKFRYLEMLKLSDAPINSVLCPDIRGTFLLSEEIASPRMSC